MKVGETVFCALSQQQSLLHGAVSTSRLTVGDCVGFKHCALVGTVGKRSLEVSLPQVIYNGIHAQGIASMEWHDEWSLLQYGE
eukprot:6461190-Amphidinium_carterae.1